MVRRHKWYAFKSCFCLVLKAVICSDVDDHLSLTVPLLLLLKGNRKNQLNWSILLRILCMDSQKYMWKSMPVIVSNCGEGKHVSLALFFGLNITCILGFEINVLLLSVNSIHDIKNDEVTQDEIILFVKALEQHFFYYFQITLQVRNSFLSLL